jgi:hypothetical protein
VAGNVGPITAVKTGPGECQLSALIGGELEFKVALRALAHPVDFDSQR